MKNRMFVLWFIAMVVVLWVGQVWGEETDGERLRDKDHLSVYGANDFNFGIELSSAIVDASKYKEFIDRWKNIYITGSLTFLQKPKGSTFHSDSFPALEIGPTIYIPAWGKDLSSYLTASVGMISDSFGSPTALGAPSENETFYYFSPTIGFFKKYGQLTLTFDVKQIIFSKEPIILFRCGIGLGYVQKN